jgi:branched-chain amino acid transport system permease protein
MTAGRWSLAGAAALVLLAPPLVLRDYPLNVLCEGLIFAVFAMSLDLLLGYTGLPSLGHAAFFGASAYGVGLAVLRAGSPLWLASLAGIGASVLIALVFGALALRTRGAYFLMITLAMAQVLWGVAWSWRSVTRGDDGLSGIPRPELGLAGVSFWEPGHFYYLALLVAIGAGVLMALVVRSPFGYALRGIRENRLRMQMLGYEVWRYEYAIFVLGGFFAGTAGVLYAWFNGFVNPSLLSVGLSAQVLLTVVVGGAGSLVGPAMAAIVIAVLQSLVTDYTKRWALVLGLLYAAVAILAPQGVPARVGREWERWRGRSGDRGRR